MDFSFLDDWTEQEAGPKLAEVGEGYRNIWVAAEIIDGALSSATLEAMGQARDLADQIGVYVYGVLLGDAVEALGQKLFAYGADIVLVAIMPKATASIANSLRINVNSFGCDGSSGDLRCEYGQLSQTGTPAHVHAPLSAQG